MPQFSFILGYYHDEESQVITWANYSRSVSTRSPSNRPSWQGRFGHLDLDSGYQEYQADTTLGQSGASIFEIARAIINPASTVATTAVIQHSKRVMDVVPWQYRTDLPQ